MRGIHHVTAIAVDPLKDHDFYCDLGLRFLDRSGAAVIALEFEEALEALA